jgi:hypothetical protein
VSPAPKDGPRDWDKELAEIDKLLESSGAAAPPPPRTTTATGAGKPQSPGPSPAASARRDALFTWLRLALAVSLGLGMLQWPYTHGCGFPLYGYLAGVLVVIIASLWTIVSSWRTRSAVAHFLSIALLFWGATLGSREVLPRVGYAKHAATWSCPAVAAPAPAPQGAAPGAGTAEPVGPAAAPEQAPASVPAPARDSAAPTP